MSRRIQIPRKVWRASFTRIRGHYALRFCIMNWRTTEDDVARILYAIQAASAED